MSNNTASQIRTRAVKSMCGGSYDMPRSHNMLSHLTNNRALRDYKYETANKLVKQQEELLRKLGKVRAAIEMEEDSIGKTKEYCQESSSSDKYKRTLQNAEDLRMRREIDEAMAPAKDKQVVITKEKSRLKGNTKYSVVQRDYMNLDLEKLEEKADEIFNRYKHKTEAGEVSEPAHSSYLYDVDNLPGSAYLRDVFPQDKEKTYMYDSDNLAQYFPIARYLLY